jgi:hypothetical protein
MTCEFAIDDGAYVLGALSPAERADFERHLATCAACREAVAALAVLPGLLGRLDPASAAALAGGYESTPPAPPTVLPRVLAAVAQQRRFDRRRVRRRRITFSAGLVAAALVLVVGVGMGVHLHDSTPVVPVTMSAMRPAPSVSWTPVGADVGIMATPGGTKLIMTCWYSAGYDDSWVLKIMVYPRSGPPDQIGTWTADSGEKLNVSGITHITPDQIDHVELQRADNIALLWWTPS